MTRITAGLLIATAVGTPSAAQPAGWLMELRYEPGQNQVSPLHPTCAVRISAWFSPPDHAWAFGHTNLHAADGRWQDPVPLVHGKQTYRMEGSSITFIAGSQVHFPPILPADPRNPFPFFQATWTTTDFTPRAVHLNTATRYFDIYPDANSPRSESRLEILVEGTDIIRVAPAPGTAVLVPLVAVFVAQRRRP
jgi:hypothetical protein